MATSQIDLKQEQQATLSRLPLEHTLAARLFFKAFDLLTGSRTTLYKVQLLEILAGIPYRAWEIRQYHELTRFFDDEERRSRALRLMAWAREAQDNEYWHLLLLREKIKDNKGREPWFLSPAIVWSMIFIYRTFAWVLALFSIRSALSFNAEFEDHAERVYAAFVGEHPEWENQAVESPLADNYGTFANWADLFRRIALDERDHRNRSFRFCGRPQDVIRYPGMPEDSESERRD
jgi:hypothetical protein